jgi:hypothetical protein
VVVRTEKRMCKEDMALLLLTLLVQAEKRLDRLWGCGQVNGDSEWGRQGQPAGME